MARYEMHNHGRINVIFPYKKNVIIITGHRTERTDDPELARIAGGYTFISVKENVPALEVLAKKELIERAKESGIEVNSKMTKAQLQGAIASGK